MPGKSKEGGGLEVGAAYKMKNSALHMGAKHGAPIQANYGSPADMYSSPAKNNEKKSRGTKGKMTKITTLKDGKKVENQKNTDYYIGESRSDSTSFYNKYNELKEIGRKYLADKKKN